MLKKVLVFVGLVCFLWGLWSASSVMMRLEAANVGTRVKKEKAVSQKGPVETKSGVRFVYKGKAEKVYVAGTFNNWLNASEGKVETIDPQYVMQDEDKDGVWEVVIKLSPGSYQYKFVVDDDTNWIIDPENPEKFTDPDGNENSVVEVKKGVGKIIKKTEGGPVETDKGIKFVYKGKADAVYLAGDFFGDKTWDRSKKLMKQTKPDIWELTVPVQSGRYEYKFVVDNTWIEDPENPETITNEFGGKNSVLEVTGRIKAIKQELKRATEPVKTPQGIKFTYSAPNASSVYLAGGFNNWSTSADIMKKDAKGIWTITKKLSSGKYQYKFVVDGTWVEDTENPNKVNDGFGGINSVIEVK